MRLFHISQTRPLSKEELAARKDEPAKGKAAKGKVVNISEAHPQ
jgi:hypothetical protein